MVSKKEKDRAIRFICDILENSQAYVIDNYDEKQALVHEIEDTTRRSERISVLLANCLGTINDYRQAFQKNNAQNIYTSPVLYKDGKTAFVRMVERNPSTREDKSLKLYTLDQINEMLHLRKIEKELMNPLGNRLLYYQAPTIWIKESLKEFQLQPVRFDYSHIERGDPAYGYVHNRYSIDYKLPVEQKRGTLSAKFDFNRNPGRRIIPLVPG